MELNSILIKNAGTDVLNDSYRVVDETKTGQSRVWVNVDSTYKIYYNGTCWVISDYAGSIVYYSLLLVDPDKVDQQVYGDYENPWDTDPSWMVYTGNKGKEPIPTLVCFQDPNIVVNTTTNDPYTDPSTGDTVTETVTTYTNMTSGNVYSETSVTREKTKYVDQTITRQSTPNLIIGKVYRFTFIADFASLGCTGVGDLDNGLYKIEKICSYMDLIKGGIDVYANLYEPLGLSKDLYTHDEASFNETMFYKLINAYDEAKVLYMPLSFINGTPVSSIDAYGKYILSIDLGLHQDIEMISNLIEDIELLLKSKYGIEREMTPTDDNIPIDRNNPDTFEYGPELTKFVQYDTVYLEVDDYNDIEAARKAKCGYYAVGTADTVKILDRNVGDTIKVGDNLVTLTTSNISTYKNKLYVIAKKTIDADTDIGLTIYKDRAPIILTSLNIGLYDETVQTIVHFVKPTALYSEETETAYNKLVNRILTVEANKMFLENKKLKTQVKTYEAALSKRRE